MRRKNKATLEIALQQVRDLLSGAALRTMAAVQDVGAIAMAAIGDSSSDLHQIHPKKRDAWIRFTDVLSGLSEMGRLYAPAGILWRMPTKGDGAHVIRGRKMNGPGGPLVIADGGDGATDNVIPDWFPDDAGLYEPTKKLRVEAKNDEVHLTGKSAKVEATNGNTDLTGTVVNVNGSDYFLLKSDTFLADFATNWNLLLGVLGAGTQGTPVAQTLTGLAAVLTQLTQFGANLAGATYKSTKAKNG